MESFNHFSDPFAVHELADAILGSIPIRKVKVKKVHVNLTLTFSAFLFVQLTCIAFVLHELKQISDIIVNVEAFAKQS